MCLMATPRAGINYHQVGAEQGGARCIAQGKDWA